MANLITGRQYDDIKNRRYTLISYDRDTMRRTGTYTGDLVKISNYMLLRQDLGHLLLTKNQLSVMETCEWDMNHILAIVSSRKQGDAQ